jgi:hypothetical protein
MFQDPLFQVVYRTRSIFPLVTELNIKFEEFFFFNLLHNFFF